MKWSILLLIFLGLIAAFAAAVLVAALQTDRQVAEHPTDAQVLVATRPLSGMSVVNAEDVEVKTLDRHELPEGYMSNTVQVVGKVLAVPVVEGQPFTPRLFIGEGSGVHLASALPEGMRAVSVSLPSSAGMEGLLYPGSVVDVMVSLSVPDQRAGRRGKEALSTTLLEGIQVLAVERETVVSGKEGETPEAATSSSSSVSRRIMVTLMLKPEQAEALQLATEYGEITLAMRNPLDDEPVPTQVTFLSNLTQEPNRYAPLAMMLRQAGQDMPQSQADRGAPMTDADLFDSDPPAEPASSEERPLSPKGEAQDLQRLWEMLVIRGGNRETLSFPHPDGAGQQDMDDPAAMSSDETD